jgi:class 3 adenylate cyclase
MDFGDWLRRLGLGQYEATFRENKIDADVLLELTESDLEKLGVHLGDRRRLLKAISGLGAVPATIFSPSTAVVAFDVEIAQRRQLTVLFCDLVGSTALSTRLDPEDLGDLIRSFQGAVQAAVVRFDGHVARLMGDGALVYFGYPRAHEDDAERAVRAGLALVDAVKALQQELRRT